METKLIYVRSFGYRPIAKESDEDNAIKNGSDELVFFYVPDDVFVKSDEEIENYVNNNVF